jgi:galactose mutarotase-like enzyme
MSARQAGSSRSAGENSEPASSRWAAGSASTRSRADRYWILIRPVPSATGRRFEVAGYQLALTEVGKQSAIHGFLGVAATAGSLQTQTRVMMKKRLRPTDGYPFLSYVKVDHALGDEGLSVATTAANGGAAHIRTAPASTGHGAARLARREAEAMTIRAGARDGGILLYVLRGFASR